MFYKTFDIVKNNSRLLTIYVALIVDIAYL